MFNQPEVAKYLCTSRPVLKSIPDNVSFAVCSPEEKLHHMKQGFRVVHRILEWSFNEDKYRKMEWLWKCIQMRWCGSMVKILDLRWRGCGCSSAFRYFGPAVII